MAITTDLLETDIVLFYSVTFDWWYEAREYIPSKGLSVSSFEEEEKKGDTKDEEVQGKAKDYESIIIYDSFDDRYYLDDDHSTNKFNSNQNDVGLWPIIDFSNLYLISKIFNTVYRKNEVE
ncbi:hypothetical protein HZH68_016209 [Vespula germanica]|uniref:Uncharacterized protein n=1 Tax=Vespula germanica TaxID=30212 RepID=A0A834MQX1_VESGE|nr:hypothetical protein HZH68_016209 [Vespula germanica]